MPSTRCSLLDTIQHPRDLRSLSQQQLSQLSAEIRSFLIQHVSQTGGHLGPNLGVVELTIAIHRVFDSPNEPIIFDTGHQSYVHKILTGRQTAFHTLRQGGGLSGYPSRSESEHDWVENSHASAALSYADGMAKAIRQQGRTDRVLALIGDGALTGGMAWEALNNIAEHDLPVVILVNDNGRSYAPTAGGIARHLRGKRTHASDEHGLRFAKRNVTDTANIVRQSHDIMPIMKVDSKDTPSLQGCIFADLGIKYLGPIDGHDLAAVEIALRKAKQYGGAAIVHCVTRKGNGFKPAENDERDGFHAVGRINSTTGEPLAAVLETWTDIFSEELLRLGSADQRVVAITAAMTYPTGLHRFAEAYPDRFFDVGIAEQHAVTSAAGMSMAGLHPVVAIYASFLNRAFDQLLMDVALHKCGVTFILDRAGVTGPDGPTHHGMWDMSILQIVPGLHLCAPRDGLRLRKALAKSLQIDDAPSVIRYSKEEVSNDIQAIDQLGGIDILLHTGDAQVLVVAFGLMVPTGIDVGRRLLKSGIGVTVVDPIWALPVNPALIQLSAHHELVISIEDNGVACGAGSRLAQEMRFAGVSTTIREFGIQQQFLRHGSRSELLSELGLASEPIARYAAQALSQSEGELSTG